MVGPQAHYLTPEDYAQIRPYVSDKQSEAIGALLEHGSQAAAARALGTNVRNLKALLARARKTAALAGASPAEDRAGRAPPGYHLRGKSTLYRADGSIAAQWVKTQRDFEDRTGRLQEAFAELAVEYRRAIPATPGPELYERDLLAVVPMGDPHVGLYSWAEETGADFDLSIARGLMQAAAERLAASAPACGECLVINLGDFFHADNMQNQTTRSHNALDVDTRWAHVLRTGVAAMRATIEAQLRRHAKVRVINCIGNHDDHSSQFLALVLAEAYHDEPRVTIDTSPAAFHFHRFGKVLLGATHGHTIKADQLPGIMAHDRAKEWGRTQHRHWYVGHWHQRQTWEYPGCTVEYCRTLAAKDAWTAASGYRSVRDMRAVIYHREFGEVGSHRVGIEMLA